MSTDNTTNADPPRIVVLRLPRCPRCHRAKAIKIDGTPVSTEDVKQQYAICKACGWKWQQIWD